MGLRKTAQQVWEEAEEGQAFACQFLPDNPKVPLEEEPEVVWVKGVVDDLVWSNVLWITPITYGERAYLK